MRILPLPRMGCPQWRSQQKTLWTTVLEETRTLPGVTRGRDRTNIAELLADERCSQAVLAFLATQTSAGRPAHRWQERKTRRLVRPQNGKRGNRRSGIGRGWRRSGWGWSFEGDGFLLLFTLSLIFLISFVFTTPVAWGLCPGCSA